MTQKFIIKYPPPIDIPKIQDLSTGGVCKKTKCPECEEGTLEFIGCDNDFDISEMTYECNVCHMPKIIKCKGE